MELTDENIITVLEELLPYIEADGGSLQYVETEDGYVKVRLGGACETCAMSVMELSRFSNSVRESTHKCVKILICYNK